ncbi:MAG TPA: signal peptidase I [Gaiellaceae bacterium]|nr:signal peptidase I [Gaiellaceae bacterium]
MRPRRVVSWVVTIAVAIGVVVLVEAEVAKPYRIPSASMEPTLHCAKPAAYCEARFDDRVIADRLIYRFESPKRGQIVVFKAPPAAAAKSCDGGTFIKRLIGLPGDTIRENRGFVFVDGKLLHDGYVPDAERDRLSGTWHVPAGQYFFMGDDRINSCDSRTWGSVPRANLIGPVLLTYWPPNRISLN